MHPAYSYTKYSAAKYCSATCSASESALEVAVSPMAHATGEAHFCAPAFSYVLRSKKGPLLCHIVIALMPSRPASKPALTCFVLISMVSRYWSSRLALRPASNFVSSYNLFWFAAISITLKSRGLP